MNSVTLSNGVIMPTNGFGVYKIEDQSLCEQIVYQALMNGYRLIDTAAMYYNEEAVGRAIKRSGIPREEIFVTTKCWIHDLSYEGAKQAFNDSLTRLGLDYIDLYMVHQPYNDYYGAWRAMEELYAEGKIRALGVSNFYPDRLVDLCLNVKVKPMVNQLEIHPYRPRSAEVALNLELGVVPQAWSPLAQNKVDIFNEPLLVDIAKKHGKSVAQVVLRWNIQRGVAVIPKTSTPARMEENLNVYDFSLTDDEMHLIETLGEKGCPFTDHYDPYTVKRYHSYKLNYDK